MSLYEANMLRDYSFFSVFESVVTFWSGGRCQRSSGNGTSCCVCRGVENNTIYPKY